MNPRSIPVKQGIEHLQESKQATAYSFSAVNGNALSVLAEIINHLARYQYVNHVIVIGRK